MRTVPARWLRQRCTIERKKPQTGAYKRAYDEPDNGPDGNGVPCLLEREDRYVRTGTGAGAGNEVESRTILTLHPDTDPVPIDSRITVEGVPYEVNRVVEQPTFTDVAYIELELG